MLISFNNLTPKSPAQTGAGASVFPPDVYQACVVKSELTQSKAGKDMIVIELVIADGSQKGKTAKHYFVIASDNGKSVLLRFLRAVQKDPAGSTPTEFDTAWLPKIDGKLLLIRTLNEKSSTGFSQVRIRDFYQSQETELAQEDFLADESDLPAPEHQFALDVPF